MKGIVYIFIMIMSINVSFAFTSKDVVGEWAVYDKSIFKGASYYYLKINPDYSGILVYAFDGGKQNRFDFKSTSVIHRDGYIEILLDNLNPARIKAVLSAWKRTQKGYGRLSGLIFMYNKKKNYELFNTLYFPLKLFDDSDELAKKDEIMKIRAKKNHKQNNRGQQTTGVRD